MNRVLSVLIGLTTFWPTLALAEEAGGGTYRGIGAIYFTIIGAILIYGVNDAFGKKAMYIAAPIIVIGLYLSVAPARILASSSSCRRMRCSWCGPMY